MKPDNDTPHELKRALKFLRTGLHVVQSAARDLGVEIGYKTYAVEACLAMAHDEVDHYVDRLGRAADPDTPVFTVYRKRSDAPSDEWEHCGVRDSETVDPSMENLENVLGADKVRVIAVPGEHYDDPPIPINVNVGEGSA